MDWLQLSHWRKSDGTCPNDEELRHILGCVRVADRLALRLVCVKDVLLKLFYRHRFGRERAGVDDGCISLDTFLEAKRALKRDFEALRKMLGPIEKGLKHKWGGKLKLQEDTVDLLCGAPPTAAPSADELRQQVRMNARALDTATSETDAMRRENEELRTEMERLRRALERQKSSAAAAVDALHERYTMVTHGVTQAARNLVGTAMWDFAGTAGYEPPSPPPPADARVWGSGSEDARPRRRSPAFDESEPLRGLHVRPRAIHIDIEEDDSDRDEDEGVLVDAPPLTPGPTAVVDTPACGDGVVADEEGKEGTHEQERDRVDAEAEEVDQQEQRQEQEQEEEEEHREEATAMAEAEAAMAQGEDPAAPAGDPEAPETESEVADHPMVAADVDCAPRPHSADPPSLDEDTNQDADEPDTGGIVDEEKAEPQMAHEVAAPKRNLAAPVHVSLVLLHDRADKWAALVAGFFEDVARKKGRQVSVTTINLATAKPMAVGTRRKGTHILLHTLRQRNDNVDIIKAADHVEHTQSVPEGQLKVLLLSARRPNRGDVRKFQDGLGARFAGVFHTKENKGMRAGAVDVNRTIQLAKPTTKDEVWGSATTHQ